MNLHPVACTRCRSFKRKCSRELPACQRCRRLGFDCGYLPTRRNRLVEHPSRNGPGSSKGKSWVIKNGHLATEFNSLMVFDSYFSLFIPSSFICHQPRVKRQYIEGTISTFMRDSIFCIALLLLQSKTAVEEPSGLLRTRPPSELWAERANMAVKQVFRPTLETVQTFYNIAAYWCATGKTHSLKEAASNAMRSAQEVAVRSPRLPVGEASELKQSCFWIAMTCRCLLNHDETVASFDAVLKDQLSTREDILPQRPESLLGSDLRGYIRRLLEIWLEIRQFVHGLDNSAHPSTQLGTLANLDTNVCRLYETFPAQYRDFDGRRCNRESEFDDIISLQAIYHLCRILPHLAMVRFLQKQEPWTKVHVRPCSKIATQHINLVSDLFANCISTRHPFRSVLPPFVAYCSLLSSSVYLKYVEAVQSRSEASRSAQSPAFRLLRRRLLSNLHLLNQSRKFWAPVKSMWDILQANMKSVGISNKVIEEFLQEQHVSFEWTIPTPSPPVSVCPKRQAAYFMVTNLPQVMESIVLFDPGYILAGMLESYPLGEESKGRATLASSKGSPSEPLENNILSMPGSTWKLPLHTSPQDPQQAGGVRTRPDNFVQPGSGQKERLHNFVPNVDREKPLPNPEEDPVAVMGMMEMMWLDGNELLI